MFSLFQLQFNLLSKKDKTGKTIEMNIVNYPGAMTFISAMDVASFDSQSKNEINQYNVILKFDFFFFFKSFVYMSIQFRFQFQLSISLIQVLNEMYKFEEHRNKLQRIVWRSREGMQSSRHYYVTGNYGYDALETFRVRHWNMPLILILGLLSNYIFFNVFIPCFVHVPDHWLGHS